MRAAGIVISAVIATAAGLNNTQTKKQHNGARQWSPKLMAGSYQILRRMAGERHVDTLFFYLLDGPTLEKNPTFSGTLAP